MWWLPLAIIAVYATWCGFIYLIGGWIDDAWQDTTFKTVVLAVIVANLIPGVIVYVSGVRVIIMQRWLLIGCKVSQNEILSDPFD